MRVCVCGAAGRGVGDSHHKSEETYGILIMKWVNEEWDSDHEMSEWWGPWGLWISDHEMSIENRESNHEIIEDVCGNSEFWLSDEAHGILNFWSWNEYRE